MCLKLHAETNYLQVINETYGNWLSAWQLKVMCMAAIGSVEINIDWLYCHSRLTERNCVEVITKLIELKLLEVIFTTDGKEYLTPQQLVKEIKDELYVHGGKF